MKAGPSFRPFCLLQAACCLALVFLGKTPVARAQPFGAGAIVTTNFALQNRFLWTNDSGQIFTPSNSLIRLSDFEGKIVFFDFFDVW